MKPSIREMKKRKVTAEKLLKIQGIDYEEWLDEQHEQIIEEHQEDVLNKALALLEKTKEAQQKNEVQGGHEHG